MTAFRTIVAVGLLVISAASVAAQGKGPKKYAVTTDRALVVTKEVLVTQGYEVVRVENSGRDYVVWYRRGDTGSGKGEGPPGKKVIQWTGGRGGGLSTPRPGLVGMDGRLEQQTRKAGDHPD